MSKPYQNVRHIGKNEQKNEDDNFEYFLSCLSTNNSHYNVQKQDDPMSTPEAENTDEEFL